MFRTRKKKKQLKIIVKSWQNVYAAAAVTKVAHINSRKSNEDMVSVGTV